MKKKMIYIVSIALLLLVVLRITYAYFTSGVEGEGTDQVVTTGTLSLVYKDGQEVSLGSAYPGDSVEKIFTVTNTGSLDTEYSINLNNIINTITKDELVVSYTCESYIGYVDSENKGQISGTCTGKSNEIIPESIEETTLILGENISIESEITHVYTLTITFIEIGDEQNYNQGKTFGGIININEAVKETDLLSAMLRDNQVYYDNEPSPYVAYENGIVFDAVSSAPRGYNETISTETYTVATRSPIFTEVDYPLALGTSYTYDQNTGRYFITGTKTMITAVRSSDIGKYSCGWDDYGPCTTLYKLQGSVISRDETTATSQLEIRNVVAMTDEGTFNGLGLYKTSDLTKTEDANGDGIGEEVLYYRGAVENNNLIFAGYCWVIIRTNETGGIRIRYRGTPDENGHCPQTGTLASIGNFQVYSTDTSPNYVGYTYSGGESTLKKEVDKWYTNNIETQGTNITEKIVNAIYCNDRTYTVNSSGYYQYGPFNRLENYGEDPQYKCPQNADKYTLSVAAGGTSGFGNNLLSKPVALITSDEIAYAGIITHAEGVPLNTNTNVYLINGTGTEYTMSPYLYQKDASVFEFHSNSGQLTAILAGITVARGVVPVLSIKSDVMVSGNGTYNNPYIVVD